jgi:hypothetical protein
MKLKAEPVKEEVVEMGGQTPVVVEEVAADEIKKNVPIPEDINPVVEYHPQEETVIIPIFEKNLSDKLLVDKKLFYKMAYALGTSHPEQYIGFSAIRKIGEMLGAGTYEDQLKKWEDIKNGI